MKELTDENERLKRIIANQALELEFKNELLKKKLIDNQTKVTMVKQFKDKASISKLCKWASLSQSVFYYRPQDGKRGVKPSTHIATPEENAYIEAFHSIVEREVIQRFDSAVIMMPKKPSRRI